MLCVVVWVRTVQCSCVRMFMYVCEMFICLNSSCVCRFLTFECYIFLIRGTSSQKLKVVCVGREQTSFMENSSSPNIVFQRVLIKCVLKIRGCCGNTSSIFLNILIRRINIPLPRTLNSFNIYKSMISEFIFLL